MHTSQEILLPIYGTIYTSAGPAERRGEVRSYMLRLLEAGLHSSEHVLFINTMIEVTFSADIQCSGGGGESTRSPAVGFGMCVCGFWFMRLPGHGSEKQKAVWAFSALELGLGVSCAIVPWSCCWW